MNTPYPEYEAIGIYQEGNQIQLSANLLQIEMNTTHASDQKEFL